MNKQRVAVVWSCCGYIEVEADSLEEAMRKVKENPDDYALPEEEYYVDGSFVLTTEDADEMRAMCKF